MKATGGCRPIFTLMNDFGALLERGNSGEIFEGSEGDTASHMSSGVSMISGVSGCRHWTLESQLGMLLDAIGSGGCPQMRSHRRVLRVASAMGAILQRWDGGWKKAGGWPRKLFRRGRK